MTDLRPMSGIRVLDLSRFLAAPWGTQILADMGAEVIKVERPEVGDDMRSYGPPFLRTRDGEDDDSPYYLAVNRNKKSITAELSNPEGAQLVRDLAARCDILVENFKTGDLARYGLDYAAIRAINPAIIYCSVTGFGQTGPDSHRPGLDSVFQATSGLMSMTGEVSGKAQKVGVPISDFIGGMYATVAIMAALRHREINNGNGQQLDISLLECTIAAFTSRGQAYLATGELPWRAGAATPGNVPAGQYLCSDGEIILTAGSDSQFNVLAKIIGREDWVDDGKFVTRPLRVTNEAEVNAGINAALSAHTRAHWLRLFQAEGIMCAPINSFAEALEEPQIRERGLLVEAEHPRAGTVRMVGSPIRMSETPVPNPVISPDLGQHTRDVLADILGLTDMEIDGMRARKAI